MRLIDADDLHTHKFLTPQVNVIGGRHNGKTTEQIIEAYQKGWNDCLDAISENAPTVSKKELQKIFYETAEKPELKEVLAYECGKASERPHGKWLEPFESNDKTYHKCSHCHISSELILFDNFCPNCGADMRKGED